MKCLDCVYLEKYGSTEYLCTLHSRNEKIKNPEANIDCDYYELKEETE